jgi:hypothetical protein
MIFTGCQSSVAVRGGEGGQHAQGGGDNAQGGGDNAQGGGNVSDCPDCPPPHGCRTDADCDWNCWTRLDLAQISCPILNQTTHCTVDADCADFSDAGGYCHDHSFYEALCRPLCHSDANCFDGEKCVAGRCEEVSCSSDDECGGFLRCEQGSCVVRDCATDADCSGALCVKGQCSASFGYCDFLC